MYVCMYVCMYRYILFLLNTDDINYLNKTLSLCMFAFMYIAVFFVFRA